VVTLEAKLDAFRNKFWKTLEKAQETIAERPGSTPNN